MNIPAWPGEFFGWERKFASGSNYFNKHLKKVAFLDSLNGRETFPGKKVKNWPLLPSQLYPPLGPRQCVWMMRKKGYTDHGAIFYW